MKHKCPTCGKSMKKAIGSHWYRESGLDNVHIENIPIYKCTCGESYPSIFRVGRLNDLIAQSLLYKSSLLNGKEIRFLRKNIYVSSKDFSAALGVGKTTLSKWENERQQHSESNDRLIRSTYIVHKGIKSSEARKILKHLSQVRLQDSIISYLIQAQLFQDDYIITTQPIFKSQTEKIYSALLSMEELHPTLAGDYGVYHGLSMLRTNQVFASARFLNTGSESNISGVEFGEYFNAEKNTKI